MAAKKAQVEVSLDLLHLLDQDPLVTILAIKQLGEQTVLVTVESTSIKSDRMVQEVFVDRKGNLCFRDPSPLWDDV